MLPDQPFGPDAHKVVRRVLGVQRVEDLLAQSRKSDPYYSGTDGDKKAALWFVDLLDRIGLAGVADVHLRRIHYRAMTRADELDICVPDTGRRYVNDRRSWERLVRASTHARRLGQVDPETFVDRRNPPPEVYRSSPDPDGNARVHVDPPDLIRTAYLDVLSRLGGLSSTLDVWEVDPDPPIVEGFDYTTADQPAAVELWVEKNTAADVLVPIARGLGANYVPSLGVQSMTSAINLLRRAEEYDRPTHVLYISDYDDAGRIMPVSVAEHVPLRVEVR